MGINVGGHVVTLFALGFLSGIVVLFIAAAIWTQRANQATQKRERADRVTLAVDTLAELKRDYQVLVAGKAPVRKVEGEMRPKVEAGLALAKLVGVPFVADSAEEFYRSARPNGRVVQSTIGLDIH